ncbi:helix-turn-helix domain-containing protein [Pediococcus pentosaceus]|uniref:helix-turn-helix domain-containing protein n=1 Tax=Pediococcus pentosaceus TaxID=1255 RepID=UPI002FBEB969
MQLQKYREQKGLTQEQLAKLANISVTMVQSLESGRRNGSVKTIVKLAKVLGVTTDSILYGCDNTNSNKKEVTA